MKKINNIVRKVLILSGMFIAVPVFAERAPVYISPNNDGIQDSLEVPLRIKERRYVNEWSFTISNEKGEIVRTIGNKVKLPERITFKTFFKSLITPKQGVEVPSKIIWNGFFDDGSIAPDGVYYYQFSAADDNGNSATTSKLQVIVDNTAPFIELAQIPAGDKTFGEGAKSKLRIKQSGSLENLWSAKITDADGKTVRSFSFENSEPLTIDWDGTDNSGSVVADGIYNYEISSTDAAGNVSDKAVITNIIYSSEKPQTQIAIDGSRFFAPAASVGTKVMKFNVVIPAPTSKVNELSEWKVEIVRKNDGSVVRTYSGKNDPKSVIEFDGNGDDGSALEEGEYRAKVTARYSNGYEPEPLLSPVFVLDNTVPRATIALPQKKVFNGSDSISFFQQSMVEPSWTGDKLWKGRIIAADKSVVKEFDFGTALPESVEWNGTDAAGQLVADGEYIYEVEVSENTGNRAVYSAGEPVILDTSKTELVLSVTPAAFSPNGDGSQDTLTLFPKAKASSGIESYIIDIADSNGTVVKTYSGSGNLPSSVVWDGMTESGTRSSDGIYSAQIKTVAKSGTEASASSQTFVLDTQVPVIEIAAPYTVFSPDGISSRQTIPVSVANCSAEVRWTAEVRSLAKKDAVRTFTWQNGKVTDFAWDGTDESGNKVPDAQYELTVWTKDAAGNSASASIKGIRVDARAVSAYVTNEYEGFSPNGDGVLDTQKFSVKTSLSEGISAWTFDMVSSDGKTVKRFSDKDQKNLPASIVWAGDCDDGSVANGTFTGKLHIEYEKGNTVDAASSAFICTAEKPNLTVKTAPRYFSPDNDGNDDDLFIRLGCQTLANLKNWSFVINDRNGNQFWKTSGKSTITERIIWDGRGNNGELVQSAEDYTYVFSASDDLGMKNSVEGKISIDVLVVRDGNKLKMQVPSIIFRSDNADFGVQVLGADGKVTKAGITQEQADNNERVLKRIADILKKFGDYKVTVVGHANSVTGTMEEEEVDNPNRWGPALKPLSQKRAQYVKDQLVKLGVSSSRLSVDGKGGSEPVADRKDKNVNWKNRRVEFILEK